MIESMTTEQQQLQEAERPSGAQHPEMKPGPQQRTLQAKERGHRGGLHRRAVAENQFRSTHRTFSTAASSASEIKTFPRRDKNALVQRAITNKSSNPPALAVTGLGASTPLDNRADSRPREESRLGVQTAAQLTPLKVDALDLEYKGEMGPSPALPTAGAEFVTENDSFGATSARVLLRSGSQSDQDHNTSDADVEALLMLSDSDNHSDDSTNDDTAVQLNFDRMGLDDGRVEVPTNATPAAVSGVSPSFLRAVVQPLRRHPARFA